MTQLYHGDCMELLPHLEDRSVDLILCDLPYGTTRNKWDSVIPLEPLWAQYRRIIKHNGAIVLFAQTPFDKVLGSSNLDMLKYEWIWEKESGTGMLNSKFAPMKAHENILVYSEAAAASVQDKSRAMKYNPQMRKGTPYVVDRKCGLSPNYGAHNKHIHSVNNGTRYPIDVLRFKRDKEKLHPTQKPVALLQYLILTYTDENAIVLDNCMGSGSTGVAAINTNRDFIGMELNDKYFEIANNRIRQAEAEKQTSLF